MIQQARLAITTHPDFASGRGLIGDESADDRRGAVLVGGGRPSNGLLGKGAPSGHPSQVGVFLSRAKDGKHNWIDGELFLPEAWFDEAHPPLRERLGVRFSAICRIQLQYPSPVDKTVNFT